MEIIDVTKEPHLSNYLELIKNPKLGTGSGINPCKDCKVYMFQLAKEYADKNKIDVIATGEVIGQRPMSQIPSAMKKIDENLNFEILRPLSAKRLPETSWEKSGLINRSLLKDFHSRNRKPQMALAKEYGIKYPSPGGGCFLCEPAPATRLKILLQKNLIDEKTLPLTLVGRHFIINDCWLVVARDEAESTLINSFENHLGDSHGKPAIYFQDENQKDQAIKLQTAYSTGADENLRKAFALQKI